MGRLRVTAAAASLMVVACTGADTSPTPPPTEATTTTTTTTAPQTPMSTPLRGFSLSPQSFEGEDFAQFFEIAAASADIVARVGDILEWEGPSGALEVVDALADRYGYLALSVTGVAFTEDGTLLRPIDGPTFDRYVAAARAYAGERRPPYLGLGVEVDTAWRNDPEGFERYVELFAAVAEAVAAVSPDTELFPVFQLERLSGMQGGLFGGRNDESLATWELIDLFPDAALIGFTTYPSLVFTSAEEIPDDYYRRLLDHTGGRPIVITEMGWHAEGDFGPYSGSEEEQARFVARLPELFEDAGVIFYVWSFLYDQEAQVVFDSMGLFRADGSPRPAWQAWAEQR